MINSEEVKTIKEGLRKTKIFKEIINTSIEALKKKGWDNDEFGSGAEFFRPMFEELYLGGCVHGFNVQTKIMKDNLFKVAVESTKLLGLFNAKKLTSIDLREHRQYIKDLGELDAQVSNGEVKD